MPKHKTKAKQRPSSTAWLVAAAAVYLSHHPALYSLIPDAALPPIRACLRRAGGLKASLLARLIERRWFRKRIARWEQRHFPGIALHLAARKLYIEAALRRALAQEFSQVVVLGAGYDTLALRTHTELPKVTFIEIDHPATQRIKVQAALAPHLPAPNLAAVPADLAATPLADALASCPIYRPSADTLFILEGLLMYLPPQSVDSLLKQIRDLHATTNLPGAKHSAAATRPRPRVRLAFSFLEPLDGGGHIGFPHASAKFDKWIARHEPFRWGIERAKLPEWLAARGFTVSELAGAQTLRQRVLAGAAPESEPMAQGEYLCIADRK